MNQRYPDITSPDFGRQARSAIVELVLAHLPLGIQGDKIDDRLAFEILCYASLKQTTIETACQELAKAPSGNTVREHLQDALSPAPEQMQELEDGLNRALQEQVPKTVWRRINRQRLEVAIDLIEIPYHGQPAQHQEEVRRGKAKSGTTHFHAYATLAVVHHRQRFTLGLTFVRAGEKMEEVLARLLGLARALGLRIKRLYCDKGFSSTPVFRFLRQRRVPYIIPIPARGGAGGIKSLFSGGRSYYTRYTFNRGKSDAYTTEVAIVLKYSRGRYDRQGAEYFAYAVYGLGRVEARQVFELYRRRFGIESSYRQVHQVRARTSSRNPALRLLLIGLSLMIVNLWVLMSQRWVTMTSYGGRVRVIDLTLERMADSLLYLFKQVLGFIPIFEIDAVLHGT